MSGERINRVRVRTPEGVVFSFPLAGPVSRFLAWLIDGVIVLIASIVLSWVMSVFAIISPGWANAVIVVVMFVVSIAYGVGFEWFWRGQTPGKKAMRLRVVDERGLLLTPGQVVLRNLVRAIDRLPVLYLVGAVAMMVNRRAQRLGDIAAGTIVVRHRRLGAPDVAKLRQGKFNSLRDVPHLAARLRQQVPPALAAVAVEALLRRDEFEPAARVAVFRELAAALRHIVPYPAELVGGLPDETYVLNAVDVVFNASQTGAFVSANPAAHHLASSG